MKTKDITKLSGLSKDTIRFYEKLGLVKPNRESYSREYADDDLERIEQIKQLKGLDFTLSEIKLLVDIDEKYQSIDEIYSMTHDDYQEIIQLLDDKVNYLEEKSKMIEDGLARLKVMQEKIKSINNDRWTNI